MKGISLETTVAGKVARWCGLTDVEPASILDRLQLLDTGDAEAIAAGILARIASSPDPVTTLAVDEVEVFRLRLRCLRRRFARACGTGESRFIVVADR